MIRAPGRLRALAIALALVAAGVALRLGSRAIVWRLPPAVHHGGGGLLWGGMVYAFVAAARPSIWRVPACLLAAVAIIAAVESLRLVHAPALEAFRLTVAGQRLLGRIFAPLNVVVDALGAIGVAALTSRIEHGAAR